MCSRLVALKHKRPQVCACGVYGCCVACRPAAYDDHIFYCLSLLYWTCVTLKAVRLFERLA